MSEEIRKVCVYCGARDGARVSYGEAADALGTAIGSAGMTLVYGAGDIGLMGRVAAAAQEAGAKTLGVIPRHLVVDEVARRSVDTLIVTETMHERKKVMFMNADAVIILPGGAGTLDEFFEVLTWRQLGLHAKPIIIIDAGGYWAPLRTLLDHIVREGFAGPSLLAGLTAVDDVEEAMELIREANSASRE